MTGTVCLAIDGAVGTVTLSHGGKFNAMSRAMWRELAAVFQRLQHEPQLRCVLLAGEGGHFCAGGDISEYAGFRFDEALLRDFHECEVWGGLQAMLDCDLPIVACIEGNCMGAGLEMASCCDMRIAGDAARFGAPIARLGFPMAPREAALVMRAVGELTAREMLLSAGVLDAAEMKRRGFLNEVVAGGGTADAAAALAARMCLLAPAAARLNKQTLRALGAVQGTPASADVTSMAYRYAASAEHREGVTAFAEKRQPRFGT
ncbi:MAG: enoyl-CoA hydratase/isomerase family protein [Polaromonas sp.]|nr:enoyl-CoA hydratase/isomerase family protein [Polaromonas sp.]